MQNPYNEDGDELDAKFSIEAVRSGFDLIIESQGGSTGGRPPRNTDYSRALVVHLRRMAELGMLLDDLQVASTNAMRRPEKERQICPDGYAFPIELAAVTDFEGLRLAIGRASAAYGRKKQTGGNPTKKLRMRIRWPGASGMSTTSIANLLAHPVSSEKPTSDPTQLAERVLKARNRIQNGKSLLPKGQDKVPKALASSERFVRDPEVIAWVLQEAAGRCECCRAPAPFKRSDGAPFLEVHHVKPLGEGGPDTIDNTVACCPNCHRQLHLGLEKDSLRRSLIASVGRLKDFPANP